MTVHPGWIYAVGLLLALVSQITEEPEMLISASIIYATAAIVAELRERRK